MCKACKTIMFGKKRTFDKAGQVSGLNWKPLKLPAYIYLIGLTSLNPFCNSYEE